MNISKYVIVFCLAIVQQNARSQPFKLPDFGSYPEPTAALDISSRGSIYFASDSPVDFRTLFRSEVATPTTVMGDLKLPPAASIRAPAPAMIILHGSRGITSDREMMYADLLAEKGYATLLVDSYAARGVTNDTAYANSVLAVTEADLVCDAYAALNVLQTHPWVDPKRIGLMGFSYGGIATRFAIDARVFHARGNGNHPFALHIDFYGPCYMDIDTRETTGAPYLSLRGGLDESNDLIACAEMEVQLRKAGSRVSSKVFGRAAHGWEFSSPMEFVRTLNPAACRVFVDGEGDYVLDGQVFASTSSMTRLQKIGLRGKVVKQMSGSCMSAGYIIGRDEDARGEAIVVLLRFLESEFAKGTATRIARFDSGNREMIDCPEPGAVRAGLEALENGGNAIDAGVTFGFVRAVTYSSTGNIGAGGFRTIHDELKGGRFALDYLEKAPKEASRDVFVDDQSAVDTQRD